MRLRAATFAKIKGRTEPDDEDDALLLTKDMRVPVNPFEPYDWLWDLELRYAVKFIEWQFNDGDSAIA